MEKTIGCTIIHKAKGVYGDFSITWDFSKKTGTWKRLDNLARPPRQYAKALDFGEKGDVIESSDYKDGKKTYALSLYPSGAAANVQSAGRTGMQAFVHLLCGDANYVFEKVTCGKFLSGEAILWRTRETAEYELWFGCV